MNSIRHSETNLANLRCTSGNFLINNYFLKNFIRTCWQYLPQNDIYRYFSYKITPLNYFTVEIRLLAYVPVRPRSPDGRKIARFFEKCLKSVK